MGRNAFDLVWYKGAFRTPQERREIQARMRSNRNRKRRAKLVGRPESELPLVVKKEGHSLLALFDWLEGDNR